MRHKILQSLVFSCVMAAFCLITTPRQASAFFMQEAEVEETAKEEAKKIEGRANREAKSAKERGRKAADGAEREARRNGDKARDAARETGERVKREGQEAGEKVRREGREAGDRAKQEGREMRDKAQSRRDSTVERGRKATEEERDARREEMGDRVNPRSIRGSDMTPEQLETQIAEARAKEVARHEARMARIAEIKAHAESAGNDDAIARIGTLVDKENAKHEKKIGKLSEMEKRFASKMEKKLKADQ